MKYPVLKFLALLLTCTALYAQDYTSHIAISEHVYTIRDPNTDAKRFRASLEKIGEYLALEVIQDLPTKTLEIQTVTQAVAKHQLSNDRPVLVTILRAGLPLFLGMQKVFCEADAGFIGMYRNEETLVANTEYIALPDLSGKTVILIDTMIATAGSMLDAIKIVERYNPARIIVVGAIAAKDGLERILAYNPLINTYVASVDPLLNENGYIVPGLGDAGDRCYGVKLSNHQK